MQQIEAIYQDGVFKPLTRVRLKKNQHVRLSVSPTTPVKKKDFRAWFRDLEKFHKEFVKKHGYLPDSAIEIAKDRRRDV